jgi:alcohol dehydrogenase class IV
VAVGVFIPYTQQYYARVTEKYLDICEALKVRGRTKAVKLAGLCEKVKGLMKDLDIVTDIKGLGVSRDDFKKSMKVMVEYACEDPDNFQSPRSMTPEQCEKLFWYAYEGKDVDF